MFLKKSKSQNGRTYLSIVQGYRTEGKVRNKTIEKLGYLDELEKEYADPINYFKQIISEKNAKSDKKQKIELLLNSKLPEKGNYRKNVGYCVLKKIYAELGINVFFQNKQRQLNIEYNLNSIFSLLIYNRILKPSSKKSAYETKERYFENYDMSLDDIYRSLDYYSKYSSELQKYLNEKVSVIIKRENKLAYYDVTNYYFEIPYNDPDKIDADGNVKQGFRKRGCSKEHRPDPIVQMGLLMDSNGIPMAFDTFRGNESEKTSLLPIVKRVKRDFELERVVVVADRGLNTSDNTAFLSGKNDDILVC